MRKSKLQKSPKSKVLEKGYLNIYTALTDSERRQLSFSRKLKKIKPSWDNTTIILCKKFEEVLESLDESIKETLTVLDAGCGHGNYVIDEYRKNIAWASGVDVNQEAVKRNICLDEIKFSSLAEIPYPNQSFDIVLSLWVLEHIENPNKIFKEIFRVLKPGGYFIFCTPNAKSYLLRIKNLMKSKKAVDLVNEKIYGRAEEDVFPTFYRANDRETLTNQLRKTHFVNTEVILNYDPSYTSFNDLTFKLSNLIDTTCGKYSENLFKQHIVGVAKRPH